MTNQNDPEPERYYDWMLWKMRQERKKEEQQKDEIGLDKLQEIATKENITITKIGCIV